MTKSKKIIIFLSIIIVVAAALFIRNKMLCRAVYRGARLEFDGMSYIETDFKEIEPYKETWNVVCKTDDGVWTICEIDKFPDREYVVARTAWEARVLKRESNIEAVNK
ncbi:MAG: hypothetical protein K6B74_00770 [Ruminococcus sp.]|nr:hypothetical protein [Ruminococcus sp.]